MLAHVFWGKDGTLLVDNLRKGATIISRQTEATTVSTRRGKLSKGILFLLDNSTPHRAAITHQKLEVIHFEVLKHPAYASDLAPSALS
jgi:hypothetical protein